MERFETWTDNMQTNKSNILAHNGRQEPKGQKIAYEEDLPMNRELRANSSLERFENWTDTMQTKKGNLPPHTGRLDHRDQKAQFEEDLPMNRELRANSSVERFETWTDNQQKNKKSTPSKRFVYMNLFTPIQPSIYLITPFDRYYK